MLDPVTPAGAQAMREFGFESSATDSAGAPTPGRIADRLADLLDRLQEAVADGDRFAIASAIATLERLVLALDAWDQCRLRTTD